MEMENGIGTVWKHFRVSGSADCDKMADFKAVYKRRKHKKVTVVELVSERRSFKQFGRPFSI